MKTSKEQKKVRKYKDTDYADVLRKTIEADSVHTKIADGVLLAVYAIALMGVALTVPNALQLLKGELKKRRYSSTQIRSAFDSLRKQKRVQYVKEKNGEIFVRITKRGQTKLRSFSVDIMRINPTKKWDEKWRLVMFDIPVRFSKARNAFRFKLKQLGFVQLQRSVWVFPYPCEDELLFIADFFEMGEYIEIITAESILDDQKLRNRFKLS